MENKSRKKDVHDQKNADKLKKYQIFLLANVKGYRTIALVSLIIIGLFCIDKFLINRNNQIQNNRNIPNSKPPISSTPITIPGNSQSINSTNINTHNVGAYNITNPPKLNKSEKLSRIVSFLTKYAKNNNFPTETLSITLIDVNTNTISGYKQETPRYPASVVKLFWMIILKTQIKQNLAPLNAKIYDNLQKMIIKSDNNSASQIVDIISNTKSQDKLPNREFAEWKQNRYNLNLFFKNAGYGDINISQKTFPIPELKINEPQGTDLQIRGDNLKQPIRNKITTSQAARLMYEIVNHQSVELQDTQEMLNFLTRDLNPKIWNPNPPNYDEFNPVDNFFGEYLSTQGIKFIVSKAGWTTRSRQEVAYISTPDQKIRYILVIFGDDIAYGKSKTIFPEMSKIVFEKMLFGI